MKTRITELFGIQHPIIQGGMHYVGFAELAAAVSNAGGLGIITGLTQATPALLADEIAKCRDLTDKPFGVNLTFLPTVSSPDYPGYIDAILVGGVKVVETAGNNPQKWLPVLQDAGVKVIHKCTSVRHSLKDPHSYIHSNVVGTLNVLEGCRHTGVQHLVYASTSSVYGASTKMPFSKPPAHASAGPLSIAPGPRPSGRPVPFTTLWFAVQSTHSSSRP